MWVNYNFKLFATGTELATRGSESTIQWDTQICVRSSTEEAAGSLRNPETRRTPSIMVTVCPLLTFHDQNQSDDGSGLHRVVCPNFGHPALTPSFTKYRFLQVKNSFATNVNGLSVLKLFQLSNGDLLFP